jgi:hypothetical protein
MRIPLGSLLEHDYIDTRQTQLGRNPAADRAAARHDHFVLEHTSIVRLGSEKGEDTPDDPAVTRS